MKKVIIFDLDGTIALIDERRKLSNKENNKIDWNIFFNPKNIELDTPNIPVIKILKSLKDKGFKISILSGRLETTMNATLKWLKKYDINFDEIRLRKKTQNEKYISDIKLKESWLMEIGIENVLCVFDDGIKLVEMWREKGLTCLQVAEGNF